VGPVAGLVQAQHEAPRLHAARGRDDRIELPGVDLPEKGQRDVEIFRAYAPSGAQAVQRAGPAAEFPPRRLLGPERKKQF
jgi:hypothetical protein